MFSRGSRSSISLATVTPSLVMIGAPNFFSITALRPLGPRVIFTASARALTPRRMDWREFSPVTICLAMSRSPLQKFQISNLRLQIRNCRTASRNPDAVPGKDCVVRTGRRAQTVATRRFGEPLLLAAGSLSRAAELCQDFIFAEDEVILVVHLDFGAAVLAEQNAVTGLDVESDPLALIVGLAGANGDHFALLRLLFRRVRDDDAALDGFLFFDPLDQDAIMERSNVYRHRFLPPFSEVSRDGCSG